MSENKREQELKEILKRYVNNQASLNEKEAIDGWYDSLNFEAATDLLLEQNNPADAPRRLWRKALTWSAAAAVVVLVSVAWFFNSKFSGPAEETIIRSAATERKEVKLADGTIVMLNTGSELRVSTDFDDTTRQVSLKGEGFFKVAKNPKKPFIIQSGHLKTQVLGTSFNISAYPNRERVKISVLTGRVKVSKSTGEMDQVLAKQMQANETISYFPSTGKVEMNSEDAALITSWKENKLYIDNASIKDMAELIEGFYHIQVVDLVKEQNSRDRYTIRFNRESMKSVLEILTQLTKRDFTYTNNQITIK